MALFQLHDCVTIFRTTDGTPISGKICGRAFCSPTIYDIKPDGAREVKIIKDVAEADIRREVP